MTRGRLVVCDDPRLWNAAARRLPGGTAFHDWAFLDLQERLFDVDVERLVLEVDGRPVGIVPIARRRRTSPTAPWLEFPFLGPALPGEHLVAGLRAFRARQFRTGLVLGHFDVAPSAAAAVVEASAGLPLRVQPDGTVQVDLSHGSESEVDSRMGRSRRRSIRTARAAGVQVRAAAPGELDALGPALAAAYARRQGSSPYPDEIGRIVEEWAAGRDDVLLSVAEIEGEVVSIDVTLGTHPIAVGWLGARTPRALDSHADAVLTRFVLVRAMRAGHSALDLAGRVDDDVERYKLSFGGTSLPYLTVESSLVPRPLVFAARALAAVGRPRTGGGGEGARPR